MFELLWFLALLILANVAERMPRWRFFAWGMLLATNLLTMLMGVLFLLLSRLMTSIEPGRLPPELLFYGQPSFAISILATGLLGMLALIPTVRRGIGRFLRQIDPNNMVHITALMYGVYVVGISLAQLISGIGDLLQTIDVRIGFLTVWAQGVAFVLFAFMGVGAFMRRSWRETLQRLGLQRPTARQVWLAVGVMLALQLFDTLVLLLWQWFDPQGVEVLSNSFTGIFGGLMNIPGALSIGLTAGIGEELLFRGALQPRFGLFSTAILFTVLHVQYGFTPALLEILVIALVLGVVRDRTNTTTVILIHTLYNTLNVLLMSLLYSH
nr:CPBP family intramembrane glutamic endopeptidase [Ardenticatena sp.]